MSWWLYIIIGVGIAVCAAWFFHHQRRLRLRAHLMQEAMRNRDFTFRLPTKGLPSGERAMQEALNQLGENWDTTKYTLIYRFVEKMNATVGMSPNIHVTCESCGGDMEVPVMFQSVSDDGTETRGGFKSLFVPTISDRFDELLEE